MARIHKSSALEKDVPWTSNEKRPPKFGGRFDIHSETDTVRPITERS